MLMIVKRPSGFMRCLASLTASLCLTLAACSTGTCGQPQVDSEIALMPFHGNEIAPVIIDGVPVGLIVDTGASSLVITPQAVADLNLTVQPIPYRITGIGGTRSNSLTEIPDLSVGGARIARAAAVVSPLSASGLSNFPAYGLLGQDILSNWDLDFDAAHDKLMLDQPQHCAIPAAPWGGSADSVDIRTANGDIRFSVIVDGHPMTAMLDTGAAGTFIESGAAGLDEASLAHDPSAQARGVNLMNVRARRHRFEHLVIGGVDEGPITAAVGTMEFPGVDMLLGENFLHHHRVYVAFHADKLLIAHNP